MHKKQKIIVIVGPNASGKSELGVKLAKKLNGEIISADSRQVYRGLDLGSGKVPGVWRKAYGAKRFVYKGIHHHCIDIADPKKVFTALDFKHCAQKAITMIYHSGKTPIIVGGTGFYIDAALGRIKLGGVPPNLKLRKKLANKSPAELLKMLKKLDPKRAEIIEQKNPRRLVRAIEIASASRGDRNADSLAFLPSRLRKKRHGIDFAGFEASEHGFLRSKNREASTLSPDAGRDEESKINTMAPIWFDIKRPPEKLKKRIHARLLRRLPGIIREVKKLHAGGVSWKRLYDLGLEYRYASLYLRDKLTKDEMTQKILIESWHYAKRQMTYFKKNKGIRWISANKEALRRVPISIKNGK